MSVKRTLLSLLPTSVRSPVQFQYVSGTHPAEGGERVSAKLILVEVLSSGVGRMANLNRRALGRQVAHTAYIRHPESRDVILNNYMLSSVYKHWCW